ncbi:MAG: NAD(P)/FAD-dependent oxidoreductase [Bacteroidales bacterium]|nr:NAD(P)/FAD-dependent oxidoreductase [Bacteroidales bacterium]
MNDYEMIIIGAGITGLCTGLAWTKLYSPEEHPVLIIEKHSIVGGCVSTFARDGYRFDTVQLIPDVNNILQYYEIDVDLKKYENFYARLFLADPLHKTAKIFPIASDKQSFERYLKQNYPEDAKQIENFFDYCEHMHHELRYLKTEPKFWELFSILFHCKRIITNSGKTYKEFLNRYNFKNPEVYEILDTFSSFSGLSGDRCASLLTACAMMTTLKGSYRPYKGFIQFPQLLKKRFEEKGGRVLVKTQVEKILTEGGEVIGVQLADGTVFHSKYVVSTADTQLTLGKMIGYDKLKRAGKKYTRKAQNASMSASGFAIHLGLDDSLDLKAMGYDCGYNVLTTGHKAHEKMFNAWENGELHLSNDCFHLAIISPSVQTGGKPNLIVHVVPVFAQKWIELRNSNYEKYVIEKNRVAEFFINKVQEYMIPDLKKHIKFIDISTPATYARYIGSPSGSNYDMMPVPGNFGKNRLKTRTPIKNLFLPKFSHGIWPSMQAGMQVMDMISGRKVMNGNASI